MLPTPIGPNAISWLISLWLNPWCTAGLFRSRNHITAEELVISISLGRARTPKHLLFKRSRLELWNFLLVNCFTRKIKFTAITSKNHFTSKTKLGPKYYFWGYFELKLREFSEELTRLGALTYFWTKSMNSRFFGIRNQSWITRLRLSLYHYILLMFMYIRNRV